MRDLSAGRQKLRELGNSQSEVVVYGDLDILFGAQIPFGALDGGVSQQELNLL
jgi:hypothetical protein